MTSENKLCALILTHQKPDLLQRLVRHLKDGGIDSYIHVDARKNIAEFDVVVQDEVHIINEREEVFWAGFSMIQAVINLAKAALKDSRYSHFLHISGDTYPVKPMRQIFEMLTQSFDWIDTYSVDSSDHMLDRIMSVYLPDSLVGTISYREPPSKRIVDRRFLAQISEAAEVLKMKESSVFPLRYAKGANWWCLRRETLVRCVELFDNEKDIVKWFKFSAHPDESFFNTLVLNYVGAGVRGCPVMSVWDRNPKPYEFSRAEDIDLIRNSHLPFARKFASGSNEVLDLIDSYLIAKS